MTLLEANEQVFALLDEEEDENILIKLPAFYDYAQKQIATTVDHISANLKIEVEDSSEIDLNELVKEKLGKKLFKVQKIVSDAAHEHVFGFIYKFEKGTYRLFVYVYPDTISEETDEDYEFEISEEACPALVYYAASQVVVTDTDQRQYYAFLDRYNNVLQNISDTRRNNVVVKIVEV